MDCYISLILNGWTKFFFLFLFFFFTIFFFFQFVLQPLLFLSTPLDHIVASLKISSSSVHNSGHKKEDRGWKKKGKTRKEEKNGKVKSQQPIYIYIYISKSVFQVGDMTQSMFNWFLVETIFN